MPDTVRRDKRDYCQSSINELNRKNKLALQYRDYCVLSKAYESAYAKLTDFEKNKIHMKLSPISY